MAHSLGFKQVSAEEMIQIMFKSALLFLEDYVREEIEYYRYYGFKGSNPVRFQPSTADKMLLRKLMAKYLEQIPERIWCGHVAQICGQRVLFDAYYPNFDRFNQQFKPE
ncbi:MAG: hypothetical protein WC668_00185 [Patescibacteria group bacterium]|jgi:hypothetical protein